MTFKTLCSYFEKLENTSKRLDITAILAECFNEASASDIYQTVFLCLGSLGPQYENLQFSLAQKMLTRAISRTFNVSDSIVLQKFKELGDIGETAKFFALSKEVDMSKEISVEEVYSDLKKLALDSGTGSQERKILQISHLLHQLNPDGCKFVLRIILGTMRLGFSEVTLIEALSWMKKEDKSFKHQIEDKYRIYPNIGFIAKKFKEGGEGAIKSIVIETGVPVLSARCQRAGTAEEIMQRHKVSAIENKYDGTRVQVHLDRNKKQGGGAQSGLLEQTDEVFVKTFTRNLEETTQMFPDIVENVIKNISAKSAILDCEAIGYDPKTGELVSFQTTIKRKRKHQVLETSKEIPLKLIIFDILYLNGQVLINRSFEDRRKILKEIVKEDKTVVLAPEIIVDNAKSLLEIFNKAISSGLEGIVAKDLTAKYTVGSRGYAWIKFKREETGSLSDTLEPVVLGYYVGEGQRTKFGVGAFLVGVFDEKSDSFKSLAKIGTGLTDEQWGELKERCDRLKAKKPINFDVPKELDCDVYCEPKILVSIRADEITVSPIHTAGFALRFPRLMAFRDDIAPKDATTLEEIIRLHKMWKKG